MTVLAFPSILPTRAEWALVYNTQSFEGADGTVQTLERPGARWKATLFYPRLTGSKAAEMRAFLASLRGQTGRFYLHNHAHPTPAGAATGAPLVKGAGQSGTSLITKGWTPSTNGILLKGDYIGVNSELKMIVADADTDVNGDATLLIESALRASPADSSAVITSQPTAIMKLTDDNQSKWDSRSGDVSGFTISCEEAFV